MRLARGDVVLIDAPFVTRRGGKVRPMVVIQNDVNNRRMQNTIVASITTNISRAKEVTQILIDVATPGGKLTGLLSNSVVSTENLLTVRQAHVKRVIGKVPPQLMQQVDAALKISLDLT